LTKGQKPQGCPEWLVGHQINTWQEQGLVLWNNIDKTIEALKGDEALTLLSQLQSQNSWKSEGISITRSVHRVKISSPPQSRPKQTQQEHITETTKAEPVHEEILHLPPEAGPKLIELLETKKHVISEMADREYKHRKEVLSQVYDLIIGFSRKKELSEFDFNARPFEWRNLDATTWICQYQLTQGRLWLEKNNIFWRVCVKRERHGWRSDHFMKLSKGVEWTEKELVALANEPEVPASPSFLETKQEKEVSRLRLRKKLVDSPYWIDPAVMEPARITYRLFLEIHAKPISFKTYESICGDTWQYDKRYFSPAKLADTLHLDSDRLKIDQPMGENSDWYRITSLTTYYQESSAAEQAQKVWDQSKILQQYKEGKISKARYGYQEVETGFSVFLGACEDPANPWPEPDTRTEYMEQEALRESLTFALDVADYRDYLGISAELISDEQLLQIMHSTRTRSKHLPEEIRRESKIWLAKHEPLE